jgi:hypothetical protein
MTSLEVIGVHAAILRGRVYQIPIEQAQNPLPWVLPHQSLHTFELREYGWSESLSTIQKALRALMNDDRFFRLTRIELSTYKDWAKPIPDYPQNMLPPGWKAMTFDGSQHGCLGLTVLTRTGSSI